MQHKLKKQQSVYNCTFNNVVSCLAVAYKLNWSEYFSVSSNEVARQPIVFVWIPIIIINLPWESMAAHRTPWCKVVKFGTLVQDPPISPWSKFEVASPTALAPPTGKVQHAFMFITFNPFIQYSQTRYHWISWAKPSSTHLMSSFLAMMDFPPSWFEMLLLSQIWWNIVQIQNRLPASANQIQPQSRQTGRKQISQQPFDIS